MLLLFCLLWLAPGLDCTLFERAIYNYLPEINLSYCSRKLNASSQVGCSSKLGGSTGAVWIANNSHDLVRILSESDLQDTVLALDFNLFTNASLMHDVRLSPAIKGLLVFAPSTNATPSAFSESSDCPNSLNSFYGPQRECHVSPSWNPFGSGYSSLDWPFPVVLVQDPIDTIKTNLLSCFSLFNVLPTDDTRCAVEINNFMSAVGSTVVCNRRQYMMSLLAPEIFCDELTGLNIVLSTSNTSHRGAVSSTVQVNSSLTERAPNSSLLVLTRMDARSMFERSGFGSQGVVPSVAVLLSVAVHLLRQPAFKNSQLKRDLFFVFLDNEAYDFMGSGRLNYDLREQLLARYTGYPLGWKNVYGMIELGELGLPANQTQSTYYMLTDNAIQKQTANTTDRLMEQLVLAAERRRQLVFQQAAESQRDLPLPPTASLQALLSTAPGPVAHLLLSDHVGPPMKNEYFESFLDTHWPPPGNPNADRLLLNVANTLADALYREVTLDASPIPESIVSPSPGDLMDCFVRNQNCSLLKMFMNPSDIRFLTSLNSPVPTQTYLPIEQYELKLSHLVNVLLMGLTGELTETPSCPENTGGEAYVYLMGYYNGSEHCFRTMLDLATRFVLFRRNDPQAPGWVRSRLTSVTRYVRWYRSSSNLVDHATLVLGILLVTLTAICALKLKHLTNIHAQRATALEVDDPGQLDEPTPAFA